VRDSRTATPKFKAALACPGALLVIAALAFAQSPRHGDEDGFTDTPILPGLPYHVHDPTRPHPAVVTPGSLPGAAPSDALVLFDGKNLSHWVSAKLGTASFSSNSTAAPWKIQDGYFEIVPGTGDIATRDRFGDVQLHLEWMEPRGTTGISQNRGNSGIFLMGLFEIQVLDSYQSRTYADGQAGALYGQWPPLVNALRPQGEWQVYDIVFEAPEFNGTRLTKPAAFTVFLNGILLHNHRDAMGPTIYRQLPKYAPGPSEGPLILQDHGSPVRYRNIWIRRLKGYDQPQK
jgi:hypothetical protein